MRIVPSIEELKRVLGPGGLVPAAALRPYGRDSWPQALGWSDSRRCSSRRRSGRLVLGDGFACAGVGGKSQGQDGHGDGAHGGSLGVRV